MPGKAVDGVVVRGFLEQYVSVTEGSEALQSDDAIRWLLSHYQGTSIPTLPLGRFAEVPDPEPPASDGA